MYVRKHGAKWQATVKRKGIKPLSKSFHEKKSAEAWGRRIELQLDEGTFVDEREQRSTDLGSLLDKYKQDDEDLDITVEKPKAGQIRILRDYFSGTPIDNLTFEQVNKFAGWRRQTVCASTLQTQLYYLKAALEHSRIRSPGLDELRDSMRYLTKKKIIHSSTQRDRRLEEGEYEALMDAAGKHWIKQFIDIGLESALRQGEIHDLHWSHINERRNFIWVWRKDRNAEGGKSRQKVPLLKGVREVLLRERNNFGQGDKLFRVKLAKSVSKRFSDVRQKAGIHDLRFHDLRHEAISRLVERGMTLPEVRLVSGHRTLDQLSRYINLQPGHLSDW